MFIKYLQLRRVFSGFCQKKDLRKAGPMGQERIGSYVQEKRRQISSRGRRIRKMGSSVAAVSRPIPSNMDRSAVVKKATRLQERAESGRPFLSRPWAIFSQNRVQDTSARVTHRKLVSTGLADQLCR